MTLDSHLLEGQNPRGASVIATSKMGGEQRARVVDRSPAALSSKPHNQPLEQSSKPDFGLAVQSELGQPDAGKKQKKQLTFGEFN